MQKNMPSILNLRKNKKITPFFPHLSLFWIHFLNMIRYV